MSPMNQLSVCTIPTQPHLVHATYTSQHDTRPNSQSKRAARELLAHAARMHPATFKGAQQTAQSCPACSIPPRPELSCMSAV
ncbi:hypothetical protein EJ03DRAFT_326587 [Teratosphaeria nubilosa]|uniref:Uncharacterized protein n=1 Tax=Teratosphaeria nubilosa TaxID=161662 RepID=A0A6G1LDE8_9PEZI|nr:hypothetical protein EJ03DRAFT_326587 [Teratosphaeria nubilosa]